MASPEHDSSDQDSPDHDSPGRETPVYEHVLPHALKTRAITKMIGKRIVLASDSPRRRDILRTCGLDPEIVPSNFEETLDPDSYPNIYEYPVATATEKAVEVYTRLLRDDENNSPDLVIAADTVVLTHVVAPVSTTSQSLVDVDRPEIMEKPTSKPDNYRMLLNLNGSVCEVVTGVALIYPVITAPGYEIRSMEERSLVHFARNSKELLEAYVESEEGLDKAGGFAIQGQGGLLVRKVDGDYWNVVGFPAASFFQLVNRLVREEDDFLEL